MYIYNLPPRFLDVAYRPRPLQAFVISQPLTSFFFSSFSKSNSNVPYFSGVPLVSRIQRKDYVLCCNVSDPSKSPEREAPLGQSSTIMPSPYPALYPTWRDPKWLSISHRRTNSLPTKKRPSPEHQPIFVLPKKDLAVKLSCSATVFAILGMLSLSYIRFNSFTQRSLSIAARETFSREVTFDRVVRCNPFTGIKLKNVSLPKSEEHPTAPFISSAYANANISGFLPSLFVRRPFQLTLRLHGAIIHVSQKVVDGPLGVPIGEWDPGLYFKGRHPPGRQIQAIKPYLNNIFRFLQPGILSVRDARVHLHPADFQDYGHRSEVVVVEGVNADAHFPTFSPTSFPEQPFEMDGDFKAEMKGIPIEGGSIQVACSVNGNTIFDLKQEDVAAKLHVAGKGIRANSVASFLSLPFRADEGRCSADVDLEFLYRSRSLIPIMHGEAKLDSVGLRFHPDPKTPEFHNINGKLRFEGKRLFFDGPTGELGSLPMSVVGSIHLEDGYNLMGYANQTDAYSILDTFHVDKFVPVEGEVRGEVQMTGSLEEPFISGWAESVGNHAVFDRLPLDNAKVAFNWDAIAGVLKFSEVLAFVKGGGKVSGDGAIYFDMTKESQFGISSEEHNPRSPKAAYWNEVAGSNRATLLRPIPEDELEIDELAPFRPYDSMLFKFEATDIHGEDMFTHYGGEYGAMASKAIGLISGKGVIAGDIEDSNCRVVWRSTSPPPEIPLVGKISRPVVMHEAPESPVLDKEGNNGSNPGEIPLQNDSEANARGYEKKRSFASKGIVESTDRPTMLGGGDFRGLVYVKLGDLPEARRIKVRTLAKGFDARRAGWSDMQLQKILAHCPLLETSVDSFFKGVMLQREIVLPGNTRKPRTPRLELLGIDGALAVKKLSVNNVKFDSILNGSFSFSASDFSMSLKEALPSEQVIQDPTKIDAFSERKKVDEPGLEKRLRDEITISVSLKGPSSIILRRGNSELAGSLSKDLQEHQIVNLFSKNIYLQELLGEDYSISSGEALCGKFNVNMSMDLTSRSGNGNLYAENPGVGPLKFSSVEGNVLWENQDFSLVNGKVKYRRSEYEIDATYNSPVTPGTEFGWEVNVNVPKSSVKDVAKLIQSGNAVATAMHSPADGYQINRTVYPAGPVWIQKLSQSNDENTENLLESWEVPPGLSLAQQLKWFEQFREEEKNLEKSASRNRGNPALFDSQANISDIRGDVFGRVNLKYNSRSGGVGEGPTAANAVLQAILDQLTRTSFSFELGGKDWVVGDFPIENVFASGSFEDGVLQIGPFLFNGKDGFGMDVKGRITSAGSVDGSAVLRKAPAALINQYSHAPVNVTGECNGRLQIEGNISNPRVFGRVIWTDATLNGKKVRGAKTDMAYLNGRCILNVDARIGGRKDFSTEDSDEIRLKSLDWTTGVVDVLKDLASKASNKTGEPMVETTRSTRRGAGELVQVRISAPVRFYLLRYLQDYAPSSFSQQLIPVLGGSFPFDDEWILVDVDVKKYGLVFLNAVLPELGWDSGDSDITLRMSGTLPRPVLKGRATVSDGRAWPATLSEPLHSLRGSIDFSEKGVVSFKSISGRCNGKSMNLNGDMFLFDFHKKELQDVISRNEKTLATMRPRGWSERKKRRSLGIDIAEAKNIYQKGSRGLYLDFGDIPVNVERSLQSNMSGKIHLTGVASDPIVGGSISFSNGIVFLSNAAGSGLRGMSPKDDSMGLSKVVENREEISMKKGEIGNTENGKNEKKWGWEQMLGTKKDDGRKGVRLKKFEVWLGRNVKVVQPFMLNLDIMGKVAFDGTTVAPELSGEVELLRGNMNLLASRMGVRREEKNYIRFVRQETWEESKSATEPVIKIALENENLVARISECGISSWAQNLTLTDKTGDGMSEDRLSELLMSSLETSGSGEMVKRILANYVVSSAYVGGSIGKLDWKLFPSLVTSQRGNSGIDLAEELGGEGQIDFHGLTATYRKSLKGVSEGKLLIRLWNFIKMTISFNGKDISSEVEVEVKAWGDKDDDVEEEEEDNVVGEIREDMKDGGAGGGSRMFIDGGGKRDTDNGGR